MSEKIKLNVTMTCKADSYKQANNLCVVEEIVPIPDVDFLEMATYPCRDNPHITLHKDSMYADSEAMHCVLFIAEKQGDGFLVECEGYDYARYSQYIPHAADIVAGQQMRTSSAFKNLKDAIGTRLSFLIPESQAEPNYRIPIDAVFGTERVQECLMDIAREAIDERPGFSGVTLTENDGIVTIDSPKYDSLRFISPLRVDIEPYTADRMLDPFEAAKHLESINFALEDDRGLSVHIGLMEKCDDIDLREKVYEAFPRAAVINGELVAVTDVKITTQLNDEDMEKLKTFIAEQYVYNWGQEFYRNGVMSGDERIFVDFGNAYDPQIMTEEEWEQSQGEGLALQQ
ncbi:MAG: hypothetical protein IK093_19830 [Ruminiclostridium sp.]|nr:hypothetical protein [Ruminiclostridium sp.]